MEKIKCDGCKRIMEKDVTCRPVRTTNGIKYLCYKCYRERMKYKEFLGEK